MGISDRNKTLCGRKRNKNEAKNLQTFLLNVNGESEEVIIKLRSQPQHNRNMKWDEFYAPFHVDECQR
jgi:hypothetical protein